MRRLGLILLLISALALGTGLGCYTMIRHPDTGDLTGEEPSDGKSCLDCHSDADAYHWTDPYYTSLYGYYPSTWGAYYAHPWWYGANWYTPSDHGNAPAEIGGRNAWDRGPGAPAGGYHSGGGTGSVTPTHSSGSTTGTPADTSQPKPEQKETPKEEPKRGAWSR